MIIEINTIISFNNHFKILIKEIIDYFIIFKYSVINENKILYFISWIILIKYLIINKIKKKLCSIIIL